MKYQIYTAKPSDSLLKSRYRIAQEDVDLCKQVHNGDFLEWVCKNYASGKIELPEETEELKEVLENFDRIRRKKNFQGSKDINSYTLENLKALLSIEVPEGNLKKKLLQDTLSYTWQDWSLYVPKSLMDLVRLSGGSSVDHKERVYENTSWCTTNLENAKMYFNPEKNLIIRKGGRNYAQIDLESQEIKDSRDNEMTLNGYLLDFDLGAFLKKIPYHFWFKIKPLDFSKFKNLSNADLVSLFRYVGEPTPDLENLLKDRLLKGDVGAVNDLIAFESYCLGHKPWPLAKETLLSRSTPEGLSHYAIYRLKERWPEAEEKIFTSAEATVDYCVAFKFRAPEDIEEEYIIPDRYEVFHYLKTCVKKAWPAFEIYYKLDRNMLKKYKMDLGKL